MDNPTLTCKRIAVRYPVSNAWGWFGPPVHFTFRGGFEHPLNWYTAHVALEKMCEAAIRQYGLANCQIIEAPSEEVYELVDLGEL